MSDWPRYIFGIYGDRLIMARTGWPHSAPEGLPVLESEVREFAEKLLSLADGKIDSFTMGGDKDEEDEP